MARGETFAQYPAVHSTTRIAGLLSFIGGIGSARVVIGEQREEKVTS
jgi:hypothetical protein